MSANIFKDCLDCFREGLLSFEEFCGIVSDFGGNVEVAGDSAVVTLDGTSYTVNKND